MTVTEFVKQYHKAFVKAVKAYRISSENAEDLCQARYVQWLQRANPLEIAKPEYFIKTMAYWVMIDHRRRQTHQPIYISIDDMPDMPSTTDTNKGSRDGEFVERYKGANLELQTLKAVIKNYVLGKAKSDTVFELLILYNSGFVMREIAESVQISVALVHKEIVQWRNWLSQFGES